LKPKFVANYRERGLSPPARGAWIETVLTVAVVAVVASPPARGAWIETFSNYPKNTQKQVAPRAGGVD